MTAGRRLAVVGACVVTGLVLVWVVWHPADVQVPRARDAMVSVSTPPAAPPTSVLYVLAVGVSRYRSADFNLEYADDDARAIAAAFGEQRGGPLYRDVKSLVLTDDEVTRESVLNSMERFLGQGGPDDVAVIFLAGHGIRDQTTGSYYFLPYPATSENFVTDALRMSDFDEMVRSVRRNVRGVVLMLDTCHSGALRVTAPNVTAADDLATRMSVGEGFFLLAASKPGEESKEQPEAGHGAFTYAVLQGLEGGADADGDGLVSVSDLFGFVARQVPRLTDGRQHPYSKVEGTDLILAAVPPGTAPANSPRAVPSLSFTAPAAPTAVLNSIGVMEFRALKPDPAHEWIGKAVRVALNTELSKVRALRVYSPELIDRTAAAEHADYLSTARRLGIRKLVSGSFHVVGDDVRIDAEIIDSRSGVQEASDSVQGPLEDFFDLQKKLVLSMLRRLQVEVSAQEGASIETRSNTSVDAYRLLLESEGLVGERPTPAARGARSPLSQGATRWWRYAALLSTPALAADVDPDLVAEAEQLLEAYRRALEDKDVDRLAALYVSFSPRQRDAVRVYLENATGLTVEFSDVAVEPRGNDLAVTYTRHDRFVDRESDKAQRLEVRLTKILVREKGQWKIAGGR
jgi:uncharacterized caspase-like protein/TolB-like protein